MLKSVIVRREKDHVTVRLKTDEFKIRLKIGLLYLWHLVFERPNCHTELSQCRQDYNIRG